ncbi:MAG: transcriptional regulator [Cyanobium sp.]
MRHQGQLIERSQLFEEVWGHSSVSDVSFARAVHGLRQVFEKGPLGSGVISTTYGSEYVFSAPVQAVWEQETEPIGRPLPPLAPVRWNITLKPGSHLGTLIPFSSVDPRSSSSDAWRPRPRH